MPSMNNPGDPPQEGEGEEEEQQDYMDDGDEEILMGEDGMYEEIDLGSDPGDGPEGEILDDLDDLAVGGTEASEPIKDDSACSFDKHKGSVFCCALHPTAPLAVTGGEDDKAHVWDVTSGEVTLTCEGHGDSVTSVSFSHDGVYVATGDMAGKIIVWKVESKEKVWEWEGAELEWLSWHRAAHVLLAGDSEGGVSFWKVPQMETKILASPGHACTSGALLADGKSFAAGYADGSVRLWDLKSCTTRHAIPNVHRGPVLCVTAHNTQPLVATGGSEGIARIIHSEKGTFLASLDCAEKQKKEKEDDEMEEEEEVSVEAVVFSPVSSILVTASLTGTVRVWDLQIYQVRGSFQIQAPSVKLAWSGDNRLLVACLDGCTRLIDTRTCALLQTFSGHEGHVLDLAANSNVMLTAGDDGTAKVFNV